MPFDKNIFTKNVHFYTILAKDKPYKQIFKMSFNKPYTLTFFVLAQNYFPPILAGIGNNYSE